MVVIRFINRFNDMKYLEKTWVRIIVSLLAGGIITELIMMSSADPNHTVSPDRNSTYALFLGSIIYLVLTAIISKRNKNVLNK